MLAAGKRASEGHHDGQAMMSAIRARLARKSLPLVSADGLVMYGLQISPTVQIATGKLYMFNVAVEFDKEYLLHGRNFPIETKSIVRIV